jgi:serine/threonine-protein kinase
MGVVYLAEHRLLGRRAAVKMIRADIANDRSFSRRFLLEARAVGALNHASIVRLYDFAFEGDTPYMAMEYVTGQSLEDMLAGGRKLAPLAVLELLAPVAAALDHAHKHGVTHRDVKPANVLLADDGRTLIMDFGLASLSGYTLATDPESFLGTPDYIAPEQVAGRLVDGRADVYSLAAVIYEAVTGERPWTGQTWIEIAKRRLTEPPPMARGVPPAFAAALARGMSRQVDRRPRTASALLEMLAATLGPESQQALSPQTPEGAAGVDGARPAAAAPVAVTVVSRPANPLSDVLGAARSWPQRELSLYRTLPMVSLTVVGAVSGLALGVAWFTYLQEPIRGAVRGLLGH